ncbi:AMP-binding protein, partial [Planktothrix sp. FACHB-1355]|uniref:non-ribosomal peptide synthetase n=1 Tax=Planktothrix sp. FACHB-1355 TaxID=2692854 RepID=UPI00168ACA2E
MTDLSLKVSESAGVSNGNNSEVFVLPMSYAQQRLWFVQNLTPQSNQYNVAGKLTFAGGLSEELLKRSFEYLTERYEILRTNFKLIDDEPSQIIFAQSPVDFERTSLNESSGDEKAELCRSLINEAVNRPFDLERDRLLRVRLIVESENSHVLIVVMHHIICDGWSLQLLIDELSCIYEALAKGSQVALPELSIQYGDYAVWQRTERQSMKYKQTFEYWRDLFSEKPPRLELPLKTGKISKNSDRSKKIGVEIPPDLSARLETFCREKQLTRNMILLAGFSLLMQKYTGQKEFVIGMPFANRTKSELENQVGFFVNLLPLKTNLKACRSVGELLERTKSTMLEAIEHQDIPFEKIIEWLEIERNVNQTPLIDVVFDYQNSIPGTVGFGRVTAEIEQLSTETAKFDLTLYLENREFGITGYFEYLGELFEDWVIEGMAANFVRILSGILTEDQRSLSSISQLTKSEEEEMVSAMSGVGAAAGEGSNLTAEILRRCYAHPSATAIVEAERRFSYGELAAEALRVARLVGARGVCEEQIAAIILPRSVEYVCAALGVWLAGGAYLPIDEQLPPHRQEYLCRDAGVRVIVCRQAEAARYGGWGAEVVGYDARTSGGQDEAAQWSWQACGWRDEKRELAYVIYTSGTSGKPKGVGIERRNLRNLIEWHKLSYEVSEQSTGALLASTGFDASVWELWVYLEAGARVVVIGDEERMDVREVGRTVEREGVTHLFLPTPLLEEALSQGTALAAKYVLTGGEKLVRGANRELSGRLYNHYGPTETTVVATAAAVAEEGEEPLIGRGIGNVRVYVLDEELRMTAAGVCGELYIG